jgi:hypothetical protein
LTSNATATQFRLSIKEKELKTIYSVLLLAFLSTACDKPVESDTRFTDLSIVQTTTPKTGAVNNNIVSTIRVSGPDLCYRFAYFTVNKQQYFVDVHAMGTYPTKPGGCATALYFKDTTLSVPVSVAGSYILRFYNGTQLFRSDTVQVN